MKNNLTIISSSVPGRSHLESSTPCQDSSSWKKLRFGWTVLVTSDGAGSYANSHFGSSFVVKNVIDVLKFQAANKLWFKKAQTPDEKEWRELIISCFRKTYENLKQFAQNNSLDFKTLGCTINLSLVRADLILTAHIGDGRSCYQNSQGEWFSMMVPFKGEEAGSTVFITTDWCWEFTDECIETRVIQSTVKSVVLLTDGMEAYSYLCYVMDDNGIYSDPNLPYKPFLDKNVNSIKDLINAGMDNKKINKMWNYYLNTGYEMINESDDKTMLIAIF